MKYLKLFEKFLIDEDLEIYNFHEDDVEIGNIYDDYEEAQKLLVVDKKDGNIKCLILDDDFGLYDELDFVDYTYIQGQEIGNIEDLENKEEILNFLKDNNIDL